MLRYGYKEKEAEAAYQLGQAQDRIVEMLQAEAEADAQARIGGWPRIFGRIFVQSSVIPHFDALRSLLARRVLARQYPEGWVSRPASEEEG